MTISASQALVLFYPLYLGKNNSYVKFVGILLKALSKGNSMKKIPSKLDKNLKIYISYKNAVFGPFDPFFSQNGCQQPYFFTYSFCIHQNKYTKKKFVKIGLKIKKLRFWALAPFDPLYLRNRQSYIKSVGILPKDILIRNLKKKTALKSDKK